MPCARPAARTARGSPDRSDPTPVAAPRPTPALAGARSSRSPAAARSAAPCAPDPRDAAAASWRAHHEREPARDQGGAEQGGAAESSLDERVEHLSEPEPQPQRLGHRPGVREAQRLEIDPATEHPEAEAERDGGVTYTDGERQNNRSAVGLGERALVAGPELGLAPARERLVAAALPAHQRNAPQGGPPPGQHAQQRP